MRGALALGVATATLAGGFIGAGGALGFADADDDRVTGKAADAAVAAAVRATKGGTAHEVERTSERGAIWEVEVTRADGSEVEVLLDANYRVLVSEPDSEARDDDRGESADDDD